MPDEETTKLRALAVHRGLKLRASRRRKPGGDFGKFGLEDETGAPVFAIGADGLEATAEEIEAHLRTAQTSEWQSSMQAAPAPGRGRPKRKPPST